jgi:CHAD domain-containing protein
MPAPSPMEAFAIRSTQELIDAAVFAIHDAQRLHEADAVHRMRVSIRRLQQAMRLFRQYLKRSGVKRVRRKLKRVMAAAGELRNYDIAVELVEKIGKQKASDLTTARLASKRALQSTLRQTTEKDLGQKWRTELGLPS